MHDIAPYLETLASQAHDQGGWGYVPGQAPHLEPTCLGLLALSLEPDRFGTEIDNGKRALARCGDGEGAYRLPTGRVEAVWPTALVLFTQAALGYPAEDIRRTASRLLALRGRIPEDPKAAEMHDIDVKLLGWPWGEGNFSWAEPTAWACLALRHAGRGDDPRVEEGMRLLLDRAADQGGINYGNRRVFGRRTEPIPGPTALMLMALQGHDEHPRVAAAVGYLKKHGAEGNDLEHLCWTKLALDLYRAPGGDGEKEGGDGEKERRREGEKEKGAEVGVEDGTGASNALISDVELGALDERIEAAYQARRETEWLRPASLRVALAPLALATGRRNWFRLGNDGMKAEVEAPRVRRQESGHSTEHSVLSTEAPGVRSQDAGRSAQHSVLSTQNSEPYTPHMRRRPLGERIRSAFRGLAIEAAGRLRQAAGTTDVHIAPSADYNADLADVVRRQYETFRGRVPLAGKRVVLKPNLVEYHRDKVINTHPHVVAAAIELCKREGAAEVIVAEGPGHWRNVEYLVQASGLGDVLRHYQVPFVDLNHDEPIKSLNLGRLTRLDYLYLSRTVATAEVLISLPKVKTHHWAGATLSLKNLFGTLPGICYGWPKNELHWRGIDNSIVDIALTRTPDLAIVDGIVGMEGDGPLNGTPKPLGALIMGNDPLAVDATCCRLMQLNPERMAYLVLGQQRGLGRLAERQIQQAGETIAALAQPFDTLPQFQPLYLGRPA